MRRIGTILLLCVLFGFGWNWNVAEAFNKKPALPSSKVSAVQHPTVMSVTEDVTARTPYSKRWRTEIQSDTLSKSQESGYTEIRPGLHVLTPDSKFKNADPTLTATPDGAEAKQLSQPVRFQSHLSYGRPTVEQGDPKHPVLQASPALIVYRDVSSGRSVVLARSKPASLTFENNIATYKDAFDHLRADVRYTVRAGNLEQDVLLYEKPLKPSVYGLNDETTVLAVMTRVFSLEDQLQSGSSLQSPTTHQTLAQSPSEFKTLMTPRIAGPIVLEQDGKVIQQFARSYVLSENNQQRQAVHKRLVTVQGVHFLAEEIPATYFQQQDLPDAKGSAVAKHAPAPFTQLEVLANANFAPEDKDRLAEVRPTLISAPIIIDFISVTSTTTDFTFEQGETYLVSGAVTMTGVTTFEGGATIKFDATGYLDVLDPVFATTSSNWAVFTSKDDDSVGEVITGSTGSPSSYPNALTLAKGSARYVQIRYADEGIVFSSNETLTVRDSEFFVTGTPVNASSNAGPATVNLNNLLIVQGTSGPVLVDDGVNPLTVTANNLTMAHLTGNGFSNTTTATGSSLSITDSLFVDIQGTSVFAGTAPTTENFNAFFQTSGTGSGANDVALGSNPIVTDWFLDQTSGAIDAGSDTAFNTGLYHYTTDTSGVIEANSQADIGYHFPPDLLDYSMLAIDSLIIQQQTTVNSGKFGVNELASGTNPVLQVIQQSQTEAEVSLFGDRVFIENQAVIQGDVFYNHLTGTGTINGTQTTPLALPLFDKLPVLKQAVLQGTEADVVVPEEGSQVLAPGKYGTVTVSYKGTLELTGGLYEIESLIVNQQSQVLFTGAAELRIQKNLDVSQEVYFGPASGSDLSASDIMIHVEGSGVVGNHVNIGQTGIFFGHALAPNGTFRLDQQNQLLGHVIAKDIIIEQQNTIDLQVTPAVNTVSAPLIMPPGGSFFDSVTVDIFTITSGATIYFTTDGTTPTPIPSNEFFGPLTLTDSPTPVTVKAIAVRPGFTDSAVTSATFDVTPRPTTEVVTFSPPEGTFQDSVEVTLSSATPGATIRFTTDGNPPTLVSPVYTVPFTLTETSTVQAFATFPDFHDSTPTSATYTIDTTPPVPGAIDGAPPLDETLIYNVATSTSFLYTGINGAPPLQTGMDPATIEPVRAAVVRGQVFDRDGNPLPGVRVTIMGHDDPLGPEFYGQTLSRADGFYDMAVNGGGQLVVQYEKTDDPLNKYLPAQRKVQVPWQDFAIVDDVALVLLDPQVTTVDLAAIPAGEVLEAQGTTQTDSDGTRTATLIFSSGTTAEMVLPDGTKTPITSLSMRATEYTVGPNGPMAMPAVLPPTSAYTWMADFTADEALAAGATSIEFTKPVYGYVDNFLDVQPGEIVPNGFYDRVKGQWIPEGNGIVIDILSITNGMADLDADGDGDSDADDTVILTLIGMTDGERTKLAELYPNATPTTPAGLWRVPMLHFSNFHFAMIASRAVEAGDDNWPSFLVNALQFLGIGEAKPNSDNDNPCIRSSSIIQCEAQIYGEAVPVTGTPFNLHYNSDRVRGYEKMASLDIPLIDPKLDLNNTSLINIQLIIDIAGRRFPFEFSLAELRAGKTQHSFVWDGLDAYGREASGSFAANITIGYEYPILYSRPKCASGPTFGGSPQFACRGEILLPARSSAPTFSVGGRRSVVIRQNYTTPISIKNFRSVGLGGWTLDAIHVYDPFGPTLHLGTGLRRSTQSLPDVVQTVIQTPDPEEIEINEKGEIIYVSSFFGSEISKVGTDGSVSSLVDGLDFVDDIALAPDGTVYMVQTQLNRVLKLNPDGSTPDFAGTGVQAFSGDGGPAINAELHLPTGVAVDKEGNVYISDWGNQRVRMVDTNGIIQTIAGTDGSVFGKTLDQLGLGKPATQALIGNPRQIEVDDRGNIFFLSENFQAIFKIDPSGIITHFAGNIFVGDIESDGIPATGSKINNLAQMALAKDGSLYFTHNPFISNVLNNWTFRVIDPNGIIRTLMSKPINCPNDPFVDNEPLDQSCFFANGLAIHPNGDPVLTQGADTIFKVVSALPGFTAQQQVVPSEDGSLLYVFDSSGRHTETRNALTNAAVFTFEYDTTNGKLISVTDGDGDLTEIIRDPVTGNFTIKSADGQITTLTLDPNGYITTAANPNNETFQMTYKPNGLMESFTRPKAITDPGTNYTSTITYNALGKLIKDENPAGGFIELARTETENGHTVTDTTAEGRVDTKNIETDAAGNTIRTNRTRTKIGTDPITDPDEWLTSVTQELANGNVIATSPDGTQTTVTKLPDPRFGMVAPLPSLKVQTPGGLTSTVTPKRDPALQSFDAVGNLTQQVDELNINGRVFTNQFNTVTPDPSNNQGGFRFVNTSPLSRTSTAFTDEQGRIRQQRIPGIFNSDFTYDGRGRLTTITQGDGTPGIGRTSTITYYDSTNPAQQGFIQSITDPVGRVVRFEYDTVGRVIKQVLPDLREINFTYDANGNVESITPPGRPLHGFDYTNVDLENEYSPPNVTPPLVEPRTFFSYNLDKQLTAITRPDGQVISMGYDTGGRLSTVTLPESPPGTPQVYSYTYFPDADPNVFAGNEGNLQTITAPDGGTLSFTYDGSLLLSSTWGGTSPVAGSVSRTYDSDFRITSRSVNGMDTISFGYDNDSLLTSAGAETLDYDPIDPGTGLPIKNGLLTGTTLGVVTDSYSYNGFGEVDNYTANANAIAIYQNGFTRDKLGRIVTKTETVQGAPVKVTQYNYNPAGYLTTVTDITDPVNPVQMNSYSYDLNGNRLNNGAVYDNQDRLTSTSTATYTYTDNGELLTKTEGVDITQYTYDVLGNLLSVTLPSGTLIEYIIDGRNRRIGKKVDGVLQQAWLYKDGLNPIAELDGTGNVIARFVYASRANVPDYVIKGGVTYRIISDHLGSPKLVVDASTGAVAQQIEYDEWGKILVDTVPGFQPFAFAGGLYDLDTKLVRFGARDYDPEIGRWTSKDPIRFNAGDSNLFGYVLNDPVNFIDPLGLVELFFPANEETIRRAKKKLERKDRTITLQMCPLDPGLETLGLGGASPTDILAKEAIEKMVQEGRMPFVTFEVPKVDKGTLNSKQIARSFLKGVPDDIFRFPRFPERSNQGDTQIVIRPNRNFQGIEGKQFGIEIIIPLE